jgi:hypothetical protein
MSHIFPNKSRTKHAKFLSYPIGAKALSRAQDGVSQHDQLACTFYAANSNGDKNRDKVYVLSVVYEKQGRTFDHSKDADEHGVFDPRWTIHVYAVASDLRHDIKTAILTIGLPEMVAPWLTQNTHLTVKMGRAAIWLEYDLVDKCLLATRTSGIQPDRV